MKSLKIMFLLVAAVAMSAVVSCTKDYSKPEAVGSSENVEMRFSAPQNVGGMLHFASQSDFWDYVSNLRILEQDASIVLSAYAHLGIETNTESISSEAEAKQYVRNYTQHPVCLKYERDAQNFVSARQIEEDEINARLAEGDDHVPTLIPDPYLKSALNADYSVRIGSRILKFYDNGGVLIILDGDPATFEATKQLPFESLSSSGQVLVTSRAQIGWDKFYDIGTDGKIGDEKPYEVPHVSVPENVLACDIPSSSIIVTPLANGMVRLEIASAGYDVYEWVFGNGFVAQGNPIMVNCQNLGSAAPTVTLSLYMLSPGAPTGRILRCRGTATFQCGCGQWKRREQELVRTINGQTWRIRAAIWVEPGQAGCSMNYLRRRFGIWMPWTNRGVKTDLMGIYKRELPNRSCINVNANQMTALGNGTFPTTISAIQTDVPTVFRVPNLLNSGHVMNVQGTWWGFGITVPRLVLN